MTTWDLIEAGLKSRMVAREVAVGRLMHRAGAAFEAKDFEKAGALLREAAGKLSRHASKPDCTDAKAAAAKRELATRVEELVEKTKGLEALKGMNGGEEAIGAKIKAHRDAVVAGLEGRWGKKGEAHKAIESFLINGEEPKLLGLAKGERVFELGAVEVYGRERATVGVRFVLPRSFNDKANGAVGANAILYELVEGEWVPIAGSPVNKKYGATTGRYRLLNEAVNERADVKEHLRTILLDRVGATSPWHAVISEDKYKVVALGHVQEDGASGYVLYQLAIVAAAESMSPELAETMAAIKANMTAGSKAGEAPRYFTIAGKRAEEADRREAERQGDEPEDEEMGGSGGERQGDEADGADEPVEEESEEESEAEPGRLASVSASAGVGGSRKRGLRESGESTGAESLEAAIAKAVEEAMESGTFGLGEGADDDTRRAFFLKGDEKINGPGGIKEQIGIGKAKVWDSGDDPAAALLMELQELEGQRARLREAMQEATFCFDALKYAALLDPERAKRQRS